jgi:hypothetical protein
MNQLHPGQVPPSSSASARPALWTVVASLGGAAAAMVAALYFAGQERTPIALTGTTIFVLLGGLGFELARRRTR